MGLVFWPSSIQEKRSNVTNVLLTLKLDVATPLLAIFQRIVQPILLKKIHFCRKIFQNVRSDVQIIRSCGHEKYTNLAGEQKDEYTTVLEEYNTFVTTCTGDNCNGSPTIKVSMISVLMALVLAAVFK